MSGKSSTPATSPEPNMVWHNADKEELLQMLEREDFKSFDHLFVEFCKRRGKAFSRGAVDFKLRNFEEAGVLRDSARERERKYHSEYKQTKKTLGEQLSLKLKVEEAAQSTPAPRGGRRNHKKRRPEQVFARPPLGWLQPAELEKIIGFFSHGYFGMLARNPEIRRIQAPALTATGRVVSYGRYFWAPDILHELDRIVNNAHANGKTLSSEAERADATKRFEKWIQTHEVPRHPPITAQDSMAGEVVDDRPSVPMTSMNAEERDEFLNKGGTITDGISVTVQATSTRKSRILKLRKEGKLNLDEMLDLLDEM